MNLKALAFLPLILLGAAAAPQSDCSVPAGGSDGMLPTPLDLAGRPAVSPGLTGQNFATLPVPDIQTGCRSPLPSASQASTLRSDSGDILHSLPAPELLSPLGPPR
jgi:hypothetical protein